MAIFSSIGPQFQAHTLPLAASSASTIYDSVYPTGFAKFSPLSIWLAQAFYPAPLLIGALVAAAAITARNLHLFALRAGVTLSVAYSTLDIYYLSLSDENYSIVSLILSNIAGGFITIVFCYIILSILRLIFNIFLHARYVWALAAASILLAGIVVSTFTYILLLVFYNPLPADTELSALLPVSGWVAPPASTSKLDASGQKLTGVFVKMVSADAEIKAFESTGTDRAGSLIWKSRADGPIYSVNLYINTGCLNSTSVRTQGHPILEFKDVTSLSLANGARELTVSGDGGLIVSPEVDGGAFFWLPKVAENGDQSIQFFVSDKSSKFNLESRNGVRLSAVGTLLQFNGNTSKPIVKQFTFQVNQKKYHITALPDFSIDDDEVIKCKPVTLSSSESKQFQDSGALRIRSGAALAGLVLEIKEMGQRPGVVSSAPSDVEIIDIEGWVELQNIKTEPGEYLGALGFASLRGGRGSLAISGTEVAKDWDDLTLAGDFRIYRPDAGSIKINGKADMISRNKYRLNKTKWESTGDIVKGSTFTFLCTVIIGLFGWCTRILKGHAYEDPKDWF
ncbi:MAG: hypothetical protein J0H11_02955 [Rhizobiales bacterium]|nr:hypothetical protein [Hyphomicrobiales bacterium]